MKIGDTLPPFALPNKEGEIIDSNIFEGKLLVIYFYPMDETRGCTAQACSFRDAYTDFQAVGAEVIGISSDSVKKHEKFAQNHSLPFVLLSDTKKEARKAFGVKGDLLGMIPGRETFVFSKEGRLVHKFRSQTKWTQHIDDALKVVQKLASE